MIQNDKNDAKESKTVNWNDKNINTKEMKQLATAKHDLKIRIIQKLVK